MIRQKDRHHRKTEGGERRDKEREKERELERERKRG